MVYESLLGNCIPHLSHDSQIFADCQNAYKFILSLFDRVLVMIVFLSDTMCYSSATTFPSSFSCHYTFTPSFYPLEALESLLWEFRCLGGISFGSGNSSYCIGDPRFSVSFHPIYHFWDPPFLSTWGRVHWGSSFCNRSFITGNSTY